MTTWTSGYVSDIGYTYGYYSELNPLRVRLAFLNAGIAFPSMGTACELGFGQGLSANIHASATHCEWWGTDFNPAQAAFAQELASLSGTGAKLFEDSFQEFASRDTPEFDFIGLHGIWSWISDENRRVIVDFVRRKLKLGGVLYISYNTLPGWGAFAPMRHLMTEHAEVIGSAGHGIVNRINDAIDFTERLLASNPLYARANPQIADRIKKLKEQNRHYLAHEYFNRDWHPMHFATMARWLEPAKVQFACSANTMEHLDALNFTADQQKFISEVPDTNFQQTIRDFMVNQQFRKDYWVKGARRLTPIEKRRLLEETLVVLTTSSADVPLKLPTILGEATLPERVYVPMLAALSKHDPLPLGDLQTPDVSIGSITQAALLLLGTGHLATAQDPQKVKTVATTTKALNECLTRKAEGSGDVAHLASAITGGGVPVGRFEQLFLREIARGAEDPERWATSVWALLKDQGQRIIKEGMTLKSDQENLSEITAQARAFHMKRLPLLRKLEVA